MKSYEGLFGKKKSLKEKEAEDRFTKFTKIDDKFAWFQLIEVFIEKLNLTEKQVYKMNYLHSLNWLSYYYQKNKVEELKHTNKL